MSQVCYLSVGANTGSKDYLTVNMDVIATQGTGSSAVKKRAAAIDPQRAPERQVPVGDLPAALKAARDIQRRATPGAAGTLGRCPSCPTSPSTSSA